MVVAGVVAMIVVAGLPANAVQEGYARIDGVSGSNAYVTVTVDYPNSSCLIYSTAAQDVPDSVWIETGLYDCAPGAWIGMSAAQCPAGRYTFGETIHGVETCQHLGSWALNYNDGMQVSAQTPVTTWKAFVNGSLEATVTSFNHFTRIFVWDEWNAPSTSPCDPNTQTHAVFSDWEYRAYPSEVWYYETSASQWVAPPVCMDLGSYNNSSHGFVVNE
jgi:hypothetical protein